MCTAVCQVAQAWRALCCQGLLAWVTPSMSLLCLDTPGPLPQLTLLWSIEPLRRLATELREGGPAGASPEEIQAWCHMLNIPAAGRWRQEDQAFYFILGYVTSLRPAWSTT